VGVGPGVEIEAALHAEASAVWTADGGDRSRELDGLARERLEVQLVVVGEADDLRFGGRVEPEPGLQVDEGQDLLVDPGIDRDPQGCQAPRAGVREGGPDAAGHDQTTIRPGNPSDDVQRRGLHEILAEVERGDINHDISL
jgi:hypothetical protein